jgi:predicted nuclease of predicted toxin-antitoxin system
MKILLDESVPWPLRDLLSTQDCVSVQQRGWAGIKNGELLTRAVSEFDLFITSDQGIRYQQNLAGFHIAILQLSTNDIRRIRAAADIIRAVIAEIGAKEFRELIIP